MVQPEPPITDFRPTMNYCLPTSIQRRSLLAGILAGLCLVFGALPGFAQDGMTLEVCLVTAEKTGDEKQFIDLGKFGTVIQTGPFARAYDKFTMIKGGQGEIAGDSGVVKLGDVQTITATGLKKVSAGLGGSVIWTHGGKELVRTQVKFARGAPIIIGGPKVGENKIMILVALVR